MVGIKLGELRKDWPYFFVKKRLVGCGCTRRGLSTGGAELESCGRQLHIAVRIFFPLLNQPCLVFRRGPTRWWLTGTASLFPLETCSSYKSNRNEDYRAGKEKSTTGKSSLFNDARPEFPA